jgi:hypothetical protein
MISHDKNEIDIVNEENARVALGFLSMAFDYLLLVENILDEAIKTGNQWMTVGSGHPSVDDYHEKTKWSDFKIITPTLFLLYHALELIMKGLISIKSSINLNHGFKELLTETDSVNSLDPAIKSILRSHILIDEVNPILRVYLNNNKLDINGLYESLRYPVSKKGKNEFIHFDLHYKEEKMIPYYNKIINDSSSLRKLVGEYWSNFRGLLSL